MIEKISKITEVISLNNIRYDLKGNLLKTDFYSPETIYKTIEAIEALELIPRCAISAISSPNKDSCEFAFEINFS